MNKKILFLLIILPFLIAGCSALNVPYLNKVLPKETVTKIVFQQNEKIDNLADFAKRADALAKEKWAPDAQLKFIYVAYNKSYYAYQAIFKSKEKSLNAQLMGDLTIDYNHQAVLASSESLPIKAHNMIKAENNKLIGVTCDNEEFCKMTVMHLDNEETIKTDDLKISLSENIKNENIGFAEDGFSYGQIRVIDGILRLNWGKYHLNMATGADLSDGKGVAINQSGSVASTSIRAFATSTLNVATSTEKIASSSQLSLAVFDPNKDSDHDGLTDADEAKYGTDPNKADTDGDGYSDGTEVSGGYNPLGAGKMTSAQPVIKQEVNIQANQADKSIVYYYTSNCSDCQAIQKFFNDNKIEEKVKMEKKDVYGNKAYVDEMAGRTNICKIKTNVPILWDGSKCFSGKDEIIEFFQEKIGKAVSVSPVSEPTAPAPVVKPTSPDAPDSIPDCSGITSGTLKMDGGVADKKLFYCFYKVAGNNCGRFELIFKTADLGDVKFSSNPDGLMCVYRADFGDAGQIQDASKKYYANKFIENSAIAEKVFSFIPYESINPKEIYGLIDYFVVGYNSSQFGFSGNLEKKTLTEQQALMTVAARDALRAADIQQIQTSLELYYYDANKYPDQIVFGGPLQDPSQEKTYMSVIPENPMPNDGTCPADFVFKYEVTTGNKSNNGYKLTYCLGQATQKNSKTIPAGINIATPSGMTGGK
jgi:hypothetical protein